MAPKNKKTKDDKKKLILLRPFRFTGQRLDFLNERVAYFHVACDTERIRPFWSILFHDYWVQFPWRLPVHVNPYPGMNVAQPATAQEIDEREVVVLQTQYRVKAFMWHHRTILRRMQAQAAAHAEPVAGAPVPQPPLPDAILGNEMYLVEHVVVASDTS
ncbi:hypothetical protein C8R47DRAFT_1210699 [Mycena vitilis]|nr:hypothetical protein C8R47DRAFT_1210699 [Mycena vitilis]